MKNFATTALLVASVAVRARSSSEVDADCKVQAFVRAEDLAPDHISHGDLRIKVKPAHCADRVASVALRLQLDEFGEVKHLRAGAVLPEIEMSDNQTVSPDFLGFYGGSANDIVYDYGAYDRAMSDPAFWVVKAEERRAWSTEVVLFQNNPNFSKPMVAAFIVASPAVNYPPAVKNYRGGDSQPIRRHADSHLGYHYVAVVEFTNGTTVELPAGHTTFVPTSPPPPPPPGVPFSWNVTLGENKVHEELDLPQDKKNLADRQRCLPEELRSVFVAEVTLEEGNVVRGGQMLRGKVTVHATNGSTTMSDIRITFRATTNEHWATAQAVTGGDDKFEPSSQGLGRPVCVDEYAYVFKEKDGTTPSVWRSPSLSPSLQSRLRVAKPYFDFELEVPKSAVPDFSAFYSSVENWLELRLDVLYSQDADICMNGVDGSRCADAEDENPTDDAFEKTEEGLWDSHTPVGQAVEPRNCRRRLYLTGKVRINVLGNISTQSVDHYLKSGLPSPVILLPQADVVFAVAHPATIVEPIANTSARLLSPQGTFDPHQSRLNFYNFTRRAARAPGPSSRYNGGSYTGLLWKKKVVAMERGILLSEAAEFEAEAQGEIGGQHAFVVTP
ncbi:hypothetical protein B0H17DRAFT_1129452 [Mycena rosella]|uniref:Uncharacterized protein n=1 Tax=Mycena rosella TaxID=1033263 RepID=A0AAD7DSS5_MYCRO|nr:hypothetical protein B0H17DRAFT_1129452 [Mycena rosella]